MTFPVPLASSRADAFFPPAAAPVPGLSSGIRAPDGARAGPALLVPPPSPRGEHGDVRLRHLDALAADLVHEGLAPATRRAYRRGTRLFRGFCSSHGLRALPASERSVLRFLAWLHLRGCSASAASGHLAAVRFFHVARSVPWAGRTARVRLALRAMAKLSHPPRRPRRPVTVPMLLRLHRRLRRGGLRKRDRLAAWAAATLGFFGALRGGEYLAPAARSFLAHRTCLRRHVMVSRTKLTLFLPASKTDQTRRGTYVYLPRLEGVVCPVRAMCRYLRATARRAGDRPLFVRASGAFGTIPWLNGILRTHLPEAQGCVSTHSLRIGFATAAAAAGVPDAAIKAGGRWRSGVYRQYIRGPRLDVWRACLAVSGAC